MDAIVVEHLCKRYRKRGRGRESTEVLRSLSFGIAPGRHAALLGVNGVGKSTTVKLLAGCLRPDSGRAYVAGQDVSRSNTARRMSGYVPDGTAHLHGRWTVRENAAYYGGLKGMTRGDFSTRFARFSEELEITGLSDQRVHGLSKGQRQRVSFMIALLHCPKVLLLDEPTTALDAESTAIIGAMLKRYCQHGGSVLLTSHDLEFVEKHADEILLLDRGQLIEQAPVDQFLDRHAVDRYEMTRRDNAVEPVRLDLALQLGGVNAISERGITTLLCTADRFHDVIDVLKPARPSSVRNIGRELSTIIPLIAGGMRNALPA